MTIKDLIDNFGGKFGLSIEDPDDYYLNARYINGVPLEQIWNLGEDESNPYLEESTILESWNNAMTGDNLEDEPTEKVIDSPAK